MEGPKDKTVNQAFYLEVENIWRRRDGCCVKQTQVWFILIGAPTQPVWVRVPSLVPNYKYFTERGAFWISVGSLPPYVTRDKNNVKR
jgi:hypothetical protein